MTNRKQSAAGSGSGAKTVLSRAAVRQVKKNAAAIAEGLAKGARNGNCMSIRLLLELAEAGPAVKKALEAHPLLSLAMRLAAEPEMPDDATGGELQQEEQARN